MNHTENIQNQWTKDLALYIQHLVSPDGRDTFESTPLLAEKLYELSSYKEGDTLLDLGCGWGKSLAPFVPHFKELIGVDMSVENLDRAKAIYQAQPNVRFEQGKIQELNLPAQSVDVMITALALHQIPLEEFYGVCQKLHTILKNEGELLMADELILFNPEENIPLFDSVYRYLLENTTPKAVYEQYIKPYLEEGHKYTFEEMKENTPPEYQFHTLIEVETLLATAGFKVKEVVEVTPFFGFLKIVKS